MRSSQPGGGRKSFSGTGLILTVLVSVSLIGALATQWAGSSFYLVTPEASPAPSPTQQELVPGSKTAATLEPGIILKRDYGLWGYTVRQVASRLSVDLHYLHGTLGDLSDYAALNKEKASKLAQSAGVVDVLITFRQPIEPTAFRKWVLGSGVEAKVASVRLQSLAGARGTLTITRSESDPLPQDALDKVSKSLPTVEGVYSVRGEVAAGRLTAIASDPMVFIVDVTPTLARLDLADAGVPGAHEVTINAESPFTEMEKFGLVNAVP
jgi:hypothetical protein